VFFSDNSGSTMRLMPRTLILACQGHFLALISGFHSTLDEKHFPSRNRPL